MNRYVATAIARVSHCPACGNALVARATRATPLRLVCNGPAAHEWDARAEPMPGFGSSTGIPADPNATVHVDPKIVDQCAVSRLVRGDLS